MGSATIAPAKTDPGWFAIAWLSRMRRHIEARRIRHRSRGGFPARSDAQVSVAGRFSCSGGGPALSNRRSRKPGLRGGYRMVEPAANPPGAYRRQAYAVLAQEPCRRRGKSSPERCGDNGGKLTRDFYRTTRDRK